MGSLGDEEKSKQIQKVVMHFFAFFTVPEKNLYTFTPMFATFLLQRMRRWCSTNSFVDSKFNVGIKS